MKGQRISIFLLVIIQILGVTVLCADGSLDDGLIAYWPLNNNLSDTTGNGYDGTMLNGIVSYTQGIKGQAVKLPGSVDSRIFMIPWVPGNSSLTISGWIKVLNRDELWRGYQAPIYMSQHGDYSHGFFIRTMMRDELCAEFGIQGSNGIGNLIYCPLDPLEFYGGWHHMAGVFDRENHRMRLYIDGQLKVSGPVTTGAVYPSKGFLGSYDYLIARNGHARFISPSCRLDEIRLYNRALTFDEIQDLVNEVNTAPIAYSGGDITINSEDVVYSVINGSASDEDPGDILQYRWKTMGAALTDWTPVMENGVCPLSLETFSTEIGSSLLILEVSDGNSTDSDTMTLTISNSSPRISLSSGGTFEVNTTITLGGDVSDFDGDLLEYKWLEGANTLFSGSIQTNNGGAWLQLPVHSLSTFSLGTHSVKLQVDDGVNPSVENIIFIEIVDTTPPTISPSVSPKVLWPPNHKMRDIIIKANAVDNSGQQVVLDVSVSSNEPVNGTGDGDKAPDWLEPVIDYENGIILIQLRSERSGNGNGRIYSIKISATDTSGNVASETLEIFVSSNKKK